MPQESSSQVTADKLGTWSKKVLLKVNELVTSRKGAKRVTGEYFRFYQEEMDPVLRILSGDPQYETAARHAKNLRDSLEGLLVGPRGTEGERKKLLGTIHKAGIGLQNELRPRKDDDFSGEVKMRDLAWRTYMDDEGHIIFDGGGGLIVPIRGEVQQFAKPGIIAQAIRQQPTYSEDMRPNNMHNDPGALLTISKAKRVLVFGDLHGRYDNLEFALADKDNWQALKEGAAHVVFLGDAIHPRSSETDQDAANADSFRVMFLIMSLRAESPGNVHYLLGNHENAHVGGFGAGKGEADVQEGFSNFVRRDVNPVVLDAYERFLLSSPLMAKVTAAKGCLLLLHASPSPLVISEQGLINLTVKGRKAKALTDIVWQRNYDENVLRTCLSNVGADLAICGHTRPTMKSQKKYGYTCMLDPVFGDVHGLMLIVNSQNNTFGYLDIDLTKPLPAKVDELKAPDGSYAFRALRRRGG